MSVTDPYLDAYADLDAYVVADLDAGPDEIRDPAEADRIGYIIAAIDGEIRRDAALFDDRIAKARQLVADLEARKAAALKPLETKRAWFEQTLESWTRANIAEDAKRKTITLPFVSVSLAKQQEAVKTLGKPGDLVPAALTRPDWATLTDIKKATTRGPAFDLDDLPDGYKVREGFTPHKVMVGDQVVPGAVWEVPERDRFECKPLTVERLEPVDPF